MTTLYSRNLQDGNVTPAAFALPAAAGASTQSAGLDLSGYNWTTEKMELGFAVPALAVGIIPNGDTVNYIIETSNAAGFGVIAETILNDQVAGAGGVGVPAYASRIRLPSNCARYVRWRVAFGAGTNTGAAVNATPAVYF